MGNTPTSNRVPEVQQSDQPSQNVSQTPGRKGPSRFATTGSQVIASSPSTHQSTPTTSPQAAGPSPMTRSSLSPSQQTSTSQATGARIVSSASAGPNPAPSIEQFFPNSDKRQNPFAKPMPGPSLKQPDLPAQPSKPLSSYRATHARNYPDPQMTTQSMQTEPESFVHRIGGRSQGFDAAKFKRANDSRGVANTNEHSRSKSRQQSALNLLDESLMEEILQGSDNESLV